MGIEEVVIAPKSPWQNSYVERLIGSIRRERLNHVIVLNERHLRRILGSYVTYYHRSRTHLSLSKDTPEGRSVAPARTRKVIAFPQGGLSTSPLRTARRLIGRLPSYREGAPARPAARHRGHGT